MNFLTSRPGWVLVLLLFIFTGLAMTGPFLVRLRIRLAHLRGNNEVAGFKFAVIGVLYAVLLAFVVIVSWERFYDAEKALAREAGAAATIYRLCPGLDESSCGAVHENLAAYLRSVLADDWPAMVRGRPSAVTTRVLSDLYEVVVRFRDAPQLVRVADRGNPGVRSNSPVYQMPQLSTHARVYARTVIAEQVLDRIQRFRGPDRTLQESPRHAWDARSRWEEQSVPGQ